MSFNLSGSRYEIDMEAEQIDPMVYQGNVVIQDVKNPHIVIYSDIYLTFTKSRKIKIITLRKNSQAQYPPFIDFDTYFKAQTNNYKNFRQKILDMFIQIVNWNFLNNYNEEQYNCAVDALYHFIEHISQGLSS